MCRYIILLLISTSLLCSSEEVKTLRSPNRNNSPFEELAEGNLLFLNNNYGQVGDTVKKMFTNIIGSATLSTQVRELSRRVNSDTVTLFLTCKTSKEFEELLLVVREKLSYNSLSYKELIMLKKAFEESKELFEKKLELWSSICLVKWSTQETKFQAFMGHLFYPVQFDSFFETSAGLLTREAMQYLISLSSFYGNISALCHLERILEMYDESCMTEALRSFIDALVRGVPSELNEPHYYCGLVCITKGRMGNAQEHFKIGCELGDVWSTYRYGLEFRGKEESKPIIETLKGMNFGLARLLLADLEVDSEKRKEIFLKAGNEGIAKGYYSAALLEADETVSCRYFLKSAEGFILAAYDDAAEMYLQDNNVEKAKETYIQKAEAGDLDGFVQCGDLCWGQDLDSEALDFYEKAGFRGYHRLIICINDGGKRKELTEEYKQKKIIKIKRLKGDFDDSE